MWSPCEECWSVLLCCHSGSSLPPSPCECLLSLPSSPCECLLQCCPSISDLMMLRIYLLTRGCQQMSEIFSPPTSWVASGPRSLSMILQMLVLLLLGGWKKPWRPMWAETWRILFWSAVSGHLCIGPRSLWKTCRLGRWRNNGVHLFYRMSICRPLPSMALKLFICPLRIWTLKQKTSWAVWSKSWMQAVGSWALVRWHSCQLGQDRECGNIHTQLARPGWRF